MNQVREIRRNLWDQLMGEGPSGHYFAVAERAPTSAFVAEVEKGLEGIRGVRIENNSGRVGHTATADRGLHLEVRDSSKVYSMLDLKYSGLPQAVQQFVQPIYKILRETYGH